MRYAGVQHLKYLEDEGAVRDADPLGSSCGSRREDDHCDTGIGLLRCQHSSSVSRYQLLCAWLQLSNLGPLP